MGPESQISMAATVAKVPDLFESSIDEEVVLLSLASSRYFSMNRVGSRIWTLIAEPIMVSELCAALVREFEVDPGVCERETADFLKALIDARLARIV